MQRKHPTLHNINELIFFKDMHGYLNQTVHTANTDNGKYDVMGDTDTHLATCAKCLAKYWKIVHKMHADWIKFNDARDKLQRYEASVKKPDSNFIPGTVTHEYIKYNV